MFYFGIILLIFVLATVIVSIASDDPEITFYSILVSVGLFLGALLSTVFTSRFGKCKNYYVQYNPDSDAIEVVEEPGEYILRVRNSYDVWTFKKGDRYTLIQKGETVNSAIETLDIEKIKDYFRKRSERVDTTKSW